jgi:hypothetical protein
VLKHLTTINPGTLFERSSHAKIIPGIFTSIETFRAILRTKNPRVVGKSTFTLCSLIVLNQLPRGGDCDVVAVERETIRMANKKLKM